MFNDYEPPEDRPLEFTTKAAMLFWDWIDSTLKDDLYDKVADYPIKWDSTGFLEFIEEVIAKCFPKELQEEFCNMLAKNIEFDFDLSDTRDKDIIYESYIETVCDELNVDPWN